MKMEKKKKTRPDKRPADAATVGQGRHRKLLAFSRAHNIFLTNMVRTDLRTDGRLLL